MKIYKSNLIISLIELILLIGYFKWSNKLYSFNLLITSTNKKSINQIIWKLKYNIYQIIFSFEVFILKLLFEINFPEFELNFVKFRMQSLKYLFFIFLFFEKMYVVIRFITIWNLNGMKIVIIFFI